MGFLYNAYLWNSRLGRRNKHRLQQVFKIVYGIHPFDETTLNFCEP